MSVGYKRTGIEKTELVLSVLRKLEALDSVYFQDLNYPPLYVNKVSEKKHVIYILYASLCARLKDKDISKTPYLE